jgi:hypothetical protein
MAAGNVRMRNAVFCTRIAPEATTSATGIRPEKERDRINLRIIALSANGDANHGFVKSLAA